MAENSRITAIVPCYNCEKYLPRLFGCLECQTFDDFDVIFIDDCSTDDTLSLLVDFSRKSGGGDT